jgi:hypothetical protein
MKPMNNAHHVPAVPAGFISADFSLPHFRTRCVRNVKSFSRGTTILPEGLHTLMGASHHNCLTRYHLAAHWNTKADILSGRSIIISTAYFFALLRYASSRLTTTIHLL